ncbi:putative cop9 complex subunit 7a [Corchorus olitorius]|uniref:Cop9 complex subunit 7a n=1 Tax=Corchorus olitorius TaxID=93759 RepID=A0A1R3KUM9_9ROSI|nr:putative cop9 complex subunit 7a [Corchorus olitorius]
MDIEQKQAELIDHFTKASVGSEGIGSCPRNCRATLHPSLFAFSEILAMPAVAELEGTENAMYLEVLLLFAHGTWNDYKIAETNKVL